MDQALRVENLHTYFFHKDGVVKAVNGVSLTLNRGEILGLVGESGSGKTVTALSILRLIPYPGRMVQGRVTFEDTDLAALSDEDLRQIRGKDISMVFQDAASALNPVLSIGEQMRETLQAHLEVSKEEAERLGIALLAQMGLPHPERLMQQYTFQISGGMAQRTMLAIALAHNPRLLIADEPTSMLDVTIQAEILQRLRSLRQDQGAAILLITHNLGVVAQMADRVAVMYAGSVVEEADTRALFSRPAHPYTWGLLQAVPRLDQQDDELRPMRGSLPDLMELPDQCPFLPRCHKATSVCRLSSKPPLEEVEPTHRVACYNPIEHPAAD